MTKRNVSTKFKNKYEEIMGDRLKLLDSVFDVDIIRKSMVKVFCLQVLRLARNNVMSVGAFLTVLRILKYSISLNDGETKSKNNDDSGLDACTFRRAVVLQ